MNRKNFLYVSGTAMAAVFFRNALQAADSTHSLLPLPDKVFITTDDGMHQLPSAGAGKWKYRDALIQLHSKNNAIKVTAAPPNMALHNVQLQWNTGLSPNSTCLGDHWERTYGDVYFQPPAFARKMPWYFVQHNGQQAVCYGVKTGCATICYWQANNTGLQLTMDTRNGGNGVQLGERTLQMAELIATRTTGNENIFATASRFCKMMCPHPLNPQQPVYGINDWYVTYGNNSAAIILNHTAGMAALASNNDNKPFSVVDSGWAAYSPLLPNDCCWQDDYSRANDHFKDMALLAGNIKQLGMRPGLWTRPLCASYKDAPTLLLHPQKNNDAKKPVLDPSIPDNLARIATNISLYKQWGYHLVKHDFTTYDILGKWGNHMNDDLTIPGWGFYDKTKTTAEIMLQLYTTIRRAAKDMYLLGCNTMSHLSAGLFEINRIGDDTSGKEWNRTRTMGVNTLGFRMPQHHHFYAADGDCVGLTTAVPWAKNKQWMQLLAESSTPLFISAQEAATGAEQKAFIKQSFAQAAKSQPVGEPLDWLYNQFPAKWRLNGKEVNFDWGD